MELFFKITGEEATEFYFFAGRIIQHPNGFRIASRPMLFDGKRNGLAVMTELCEITEGSAETVARKIEARCKAIGLTFTRTNKLERDGKADTL